MVERQIKPENKLKIYDKGVVTDNENNSPISGVILLREGESFSPEIDTAEPLLLECQEFINCMRERRKPLSDASMGLKVVETLEAADRLMPKTKSAF